MWFIFRELFFHYLLQYTDISKYFNIKASKAYITTNRNIIAFCIQNLKKYVRSHVFHNYFRVFCFWFRFTVFLHNVCGLEISENYMQNLRLGAMKRGRLVYICNAFYSRYKQILGHLMSCVLDLCDAMIYLKFYISFSCSVRLS